MAAEELRSDPFTWAIARHHHQVKARERTRHRRRRISLQLMVGALAALIVSVAAAIGLGADSPAISAVTGSDGSDVIDVYSGAGPADVVAELRAALADRYPDVRVSTITGREAVSGRLLAEGDGITLVGRTVEHDFTASGLELAADAMGTILVVVRTPAGAEQLIPGYQLACELAGQPFATARATAEASGFTVRVLSGPELGTESADARVSDAVVFGDEAVLVLGSSPSRDC